ncbi:hypothetical protein ABC345_02065 [Shouchella sp. 1P09AA]|uniref:hypothetical protein n=1 Tax=unclassified Shouchella TaxID=2893065 RepID=UPI0039A2A110
MSIILLFGLVGVLVFLLFTKPFLKVLEGHRYVHLLEKQTWFQHTLKAGLFACLVNIGLVSITVVFLYIPVWIDFVMSPLFPMAFGVIGSVIVWGLLNRGYKGERPILMAFIGSSIYLVILIVALVFFFRPTERMGEALFHWEIALMLIIVVSLVAWITSLYVLSYRSKKESD